MQTDVRDSVVGSLTLRVNRVARFAVDFFMPVVCVHCEREGSLLCEECSGSLNPPSRALCQKCAEPVSKKGNLCGECVVLPPPLDRLEPLYRYEGPARSAVHALKYRDIRGLAPHLGELMANTRFLQQARIDCVLPVPMHEKKLRKRGYNQATLLASHLAEKIGIPTIEDGLTKLRETPSQVELSRKDRLRSVRGAFEANYDFSGAHVLLVDDVATTGSTLMNCAAALKRANARRVSALTFAKEMLDRDDSATSEAETH